MQRLPHAIPTLQPARRDIGSMRREAKSPAHEPVDSIIRPEPQEPLRDPIRVVAEQRGLTEHVELPAARGLSDVVDGREQEDPRRHLERGGQRRIPEDAVAYLEDDVGAYGVSDEKDAVVGCALVRAGLDPETADGFENMLDLVF